MSRVFKCDRCGEIFKENDGAERMVKDEEEEWDEVEERIRKPYINPNSVSNHIQTIHMSNCGTADWRNNDYDLCPSCMAALNDWLKGEKSE
jgi:rubredoxin